MARNIGADGRTVYRAVVEITDRDGETSTRYEGPYGTPAAARARVSFWRNHLADYNGRGEPTGTSSAAGHVERAHTTWHPIDQPNPDHTADASGTPLLRLVDLFEETGTPRKLAPGYAAELFASLARELADALPDGPDRASILARASHLDARGEQILGPNDAQEQQ
ncbi:hypothetical protein [Streptomyces sp. NPDC007063]|uniref:hypothetical protein n=1 Tax=Streptomyces sp. NPDC007063 TaxID=3364772 RepID=UPI0036B98363